MTIVAIASRPAKPRFANVRRVARALPAALLAAGLAGCGADHAELQAWMEQTRAGMPPVTEKVPEPKRFEPYRYASAGAADPFAASRLVKAGEAPAARAGGPQPDLNRRREPLEAYPVDVVRMIGHIRDGQRSYALLLADNLVYQARAGNYVGQNFGIITRVSESEIRLRELVQDAAGDWVERETTVQLQENRK